MSTRADTRIELIREALRLGAKHVHVHLGMSPGCDERVVVEQGREAFEAVADDFDRFLRGQTVFEASA